MAGRQTCCPTYSSCFGQSTLLISPCGSTALKLFSGQSFQSGKMPRCVEELETTWGSRFSYVPCGCLIYALAIDGLLWGLH
eukprot:8380247-Karenia_brevis.AAC.1